MSNIKNKNIKNSKNNKVKNEKLTLDITVEVPKHSSIKYEYDRKTKSIRVDRILYGPNFYPQNYGFIREALDWDGDELDCLVISNESFQPGIIVPARIIGAMGMIDGGETDTKLIGVIDCDPRFNGIKTIQDLPEHMFKEIQNFFETYKLLQNKEVIITGFKDAKWAIKEYHECVDLMNKYKDMDKDDFIKLMKKEHPEKYTA